jgi:glutamine synthetase
MAGLDGVKNKIHPGEAMDKDLYHLPPEEDARSRPCATASTRRWSTWTRTAASSPRAVCSPNAMIDAYIELKMAEVTRFRMTTHPIEFDMYYSL